MIEPFKVMVDWDAPMQYDFSKEPATTIKAVAQQGELHWYPCYINVTVEDKECKLEACAGESSMGGDGFVAVRNIETKKVLWLAFFDCSNPFEKLVIKDGEIHASSTLNCVWKFNIHHPLGVSVSWLGPVHSKS